MMVEQESKCALKRETYQVEGHQVEVIDAEDLTQQERGDIVGLYALDDAFVKTGEDPESVLDQLIAEGRTHGVDFYVVKDDQGRVISTSAVYRPALENVPFPDSRFVIRNSVTALEHRNQGCIRSLYTCMFDTMVARARARSVGDESALDRLGSYRTVSVEIDEQKPAANKLRDMFYSLAVRERDPWVFIGELELEERGGRLFLAAEGDGNYFIQFQSIQPRELEAHIMKDDRVVKVRVPAEALSVSDGIAHTTEDLYALFRMLAKAKGLDVIDRTRHEEGGFLALKTADIEALEEVLRGIGCICEEVSLPVRSYWRCTVEQTSPDESVSGV